MIWAPLKRLAFWQRSGGAFPKPSVTPKSSADPKSSAGPKPKKVTSGNGPTADLLLEEAQKKLDAFDAAGALLLYEAVCNLDQISFEQKVPAMFGTLIVKAIVGTGIIPLPDVSFEYLIMNNFFCPQCKVLTKNVRRSGSTEYRASAIVDHWFAECGTCNRTREVAFAVPRS